MRHRPLATVLGALLLTALVQAPASARPLDNSTSTDHFTDTITDFCDVPGMTVDLVGDFTIHELIRPTHGGEIPYFLDNIRGGSTWTNQATGKSVHSHEAFIQKDQRITDNGDGTLTILVLATGAFTVWDDQTGKAIVHDPGQIRFEILIDDNGTPADPSDDVFLDFLGVVKGSTGRSDDFCGPVVAALS